MCHPIRIVHGVCCSELQCVAVIHASEACVERHDCVALCCSVLQSYGPHNCRLEWIVVSYEWVSVFIDNMSHMGFNSHGVDSHGVDSKRTLFSFYRRVSLLYSARAHMNHKGPTIRRHHMCDSYVSCMNFIYAHMRCLRIVGSLKLQVSFPKESYKRDYILVIHMGTRRIQWVICIW